jgi:hypothetical protein
MRINEINIGNIIIKSQQLYKIFDVDAEYVHYHKCKVDKTMSADNHVYRKFNTMSNFGDKKFKTKKTHFRYILYTEDNFEDAYMHDGIILKNFSTSLFNTDNILLKSSYNIFEYLQWYKRGLFYHNQYNALIKKIIVAYPNIKTLGLSIIKSELEKIKSEPISPHYYNDCNFYYDHFVKHELEYVHVVCIEEDNVESPICIDVRTCVLYFHCSHSVCKKCYPQFQQKKCPLCRAKPKNNI